MPAIAQPRNFDPRLLERTWYIDVVPTVDISGAHTAADVIVATTKIENACKFPDVPVELCQIQVIDKADNTAANMNYILLKDDVAYGTVNAAVSISAANLVAAYVGHGTIAGASFVDAINAKAATVTTGNPGPPSATAPVPNLPITVIPKSGTRDAYFAATTAGTPTYTAADQLVWRFFFRDVALVL